MTKTARNTYQNGCLQREMRKKGPDVWVFRYREDGNLKYRVLGTVLHYKTKAAARLALGDVKANINQRLDVATFGDLCDRYLREGMPERHATASAMRSMVKYRIKPDWKDVLVSEMAADPMSVEQWIKNLHTTPKKKGEKPRPLAPKTKGHTKAVFHRLFECAMRWRYLTIQRNPMSLIEIPGTSKRTRKIVLVLTAKYHALLPKLPPHCRVMVTLAMCLGLRVSEILGLRWEDVDLENGKIQIRRSVVNGHVESTKTDASEDELPLHPELVRVLRGVEGCGAVGKRLAVRQYRHWQALPRGHHATAAPQQSCCQPGNRPAEVGLARLPAYVPGESVRIRVAARSSTGN